MARTTSTSGTEKREVKHKKRPGVHSKCRVSNLKASKHYVKKYRGQGK